MDYKEKYREALERAKTLYENANGMILKKWVEQVFPELQESEDERIRKCICLCLEECVHNDIIRDYEKDKCLAWLKKQGEQKPVDVDYNPFDDFRKSDSEINPSEFDARLNTLLKEFESLPKEELVNSLAFYLNVVQNDGTYNEQKPADKVEPKFKIGDWVVYDHRPYQVVELPKEGYINLGLRGNGKIEFAPSTYCRYWTIQDAKAGDALVHNGCTFIFIGVKNGIVQAIEENFLDGTNPVCFGEPDKDGDYHPATEEQRNLLFKKMRETGYEWDAEKKELKKIEQNVDNRKLCDIVIEELNKYSGNEAYKAPWALDSTGVQYPLYFAELGVKWQKEQNPTWSEKDEKLLNDAISLADECDDVELRDWLKLLKGRYTWKPSDRQIQTLEFIAEYHAFANKDRREDVVALLSDLKKLREE